MAVTAGKLGKGQYGGDGKTGGVNHWDLDVQTNMLNVPAWSTGTDQWESYAAGLSGGSGTISGFFDAASTGQDTLRANLLAATTGQLILYVDRAGGPNFRGSVLLESLGLGVDLDGTADVSYGFRFTGAVAYSTAT